MLWHKDHGADTCGAVCAGMSGICLCGYAHHYFRAGALKHFWLKEPLSTFTKRLGVPLPFHIIDYYCYSYNCS